MTLDAKAGKKSTGKFKKLGHTASQYGTDPSPKSVSGAGKSPRDLNP